MSNQSSTNNMHNRKINPLMSVIMCFNLMELEKEGVISEIVRCKTLSVAIVSLKIAL